MKDQTPMTNDHALLPICEIGHWALGIGHSLVIRNLVISHSTVPNKEPSAALICTRPSHQKLLTNRRNARSAWRRTAPLSSCAVCARSAFQNADGCALP